MNLVSIVIIVAAGLINAAGSAVLKFGFAYRNAANSSVLIYWLIMLGAMLLFGGCFPLYAIGLSRSKLSTAQPVFSATSYVSIAVVSILFFKEALVPLKVAGIAAIIVGMVMVVG